MRKKVQYFIAFSNFILQIAAFSIFHSANDRLFFGFEHVFMTKLLAGFILLMPVVFVLMGNTLERNEKYSGVYSYKVFPIIFIILLFCSWVVCIYIKAALGPFIIESQNWLFLVIGSVAMYLANYVTALNKDNPVLKKLGIRIKNEYVFKTTLRIALYGIGLEGYLILLCGALGFFYDSNLTMKLVYLSLLAFVVLIAAVYGFIIRKNKKRKTAGHEKKNEKDQNS